MNLKKTILLGFDVEEFDLPIEYGKTISFNDQITISTTGTLNVLALLRKHEIKATFYCTANYALNKSDIISEIVAEGHEIASHGYYHSDFRIEHLKQSKDLLANISNTEITGYRMARMMKVDELEIKNAGYLYNSSLNPTWLPGRYNNFNKPRAYFFEKGVLQIPASVTPLIRFPLFWLTFHNISLPIITWLANSTIHTDGYLNLYFHPWEFIELHGNKSLGLPSYISKNTGQVFINKVSDFIVRGKQKGYQFKKTNEFAKSIYNETT